MQMKLNDSGEKITSEEIRSFEQDFSIVLPEDYKSFLEESNGGMPDGDYVFEFFDEVTERINHSVIQEFFILNINENGSYNDLKNNL